MINPKPIINDHLVPMMDDTEASNYIWDPDPSLVFFSPHPHKFFDTSNSIV